MGRFCAFPNCRNTMKVWSPISFHRLPLRDKERVKLWLAVLKRDVNTPPDALRSLDLRVCSAHFSPHDFQVGSKRQHNLLKKTAIPLPILGHQQQRTNRDGNASEITVFLSDSDDPSSLTDVDSCQSFDYEEDEDQKNKRVNEIIENKISVERELGDQVSGKHISLQQRQTKAMQTHPPRIQCVGTNYTNTLESDDWYVNIDCLLQLFLLCGKCGFDCGVSMQGERRRFSVTQECQFCNHSRMWMSHPAASVESSAERLKIVNKQTAGKETVATCEDQDLDDACPLPMEYTEDNDTATTHTEESILFSEVKSKKELSMEVKEAIMTLKEEKKTIREISQTLGLAKTTVWNIIKKKKTTGELSNRKRSGRPKKQTTQEKRESSDKWEPPVEVEITLRSQPSVSKSSDKSEPTIESELSSSQTDGAGKERLVVEWCTGCGAEPTLTCATEQHAMLYVCGVCVGEGVKGIHFCEHNMPFFCPDCGQHFVDEHGLKSHQHIHQPEPDHVYACQFCFKSFKTRPDMLVHEESHTKMRCPYQCTECPKRFCKGIERNGHLQNHSGPTRLICYTCYKEFFKPIDLQSHATGHTGKPFKCQVCHRSFAQASHVKLHMCTHTGELPLRCQQCHECSIHKISLKNLVQCQNGPGSGPKEQGEIQESSTVSEQESM